MPDKQSIRTKNKMACFCFGNEHKIYSQNINTIKRIIQKTNKFYNQKLIELNTHYIEVFELWRLTWPYFDKKEFGNENRIRDNLNSVDHCLGMCARRSGGENGAFYVFDWLMKSCDFLNKCLDNIIVVSQVQKNLVILQRIRLLELHFERIKSELCNYGSD